MNSQVYKMQDILLLAVEVAAFQEGLHSVELVGVMSGTISQLRLWHRKLLQQSFKYARRIQ
jgi:hypothetical protein